MNQEQAKTKLPRAWKDGKGNYQVPLPQFGPYRWSVENERERLSRLWGFLTRTKGLWERLREGKRSDNRKSFLLASRHYNALILLVIEENGGLAEITMF